MHASVADTGLESDTDGPQIVSQATFYTTTNPQLLKSG